MLTLFMGRCAGHDLLTWPHVDPHVDMRLTFARLWQPTDLRLVFLCPKFDVLALAALHACCVM